MKKEYIFYGVIVLLIVFFIGLIDVFFKSPDIDESQFSDKLNIIEYADYTCSECQRAHEVITAIE